MRWTTTLMTSPSALLKVVSQLSTAWGNPWLASLSPVYGSLWTGLTNIKEWKRTSCKGKERRRLPLKRGGISGRTDTTIIVKGEISHGNMDQPIHRRLTLYSENRYIRFWIKSRMSHSSSARIRWLETPWSAIRVCIFNTTKTTDILQKTAGTFGTTWISWFEKGNWGTFASFQWSSRPGKLEAPKRHFLKTTHRDDKHNLFCSREDGLMPF